MNSFAHGAVNAARRKAHDTRCSMLIVQSELKDHPGIEPHDIEQANKAHIALALTALDVAVSCLELLT